MLMQPKRITVQVSPHRGKRTTAWAFTCEDVATARGVSVHAVRAHIQRGHLDMTDLYSIARYVLRIRAHKPKETKTEAEV